MEPGKASKSAGTAHDLVEMEPERRAVVEALVNEIDIADHNSLLFFGNKIQQELTQISEHMLEGVRNKDVGPASASLNDIVATLRVSARRTWRRSRGSSRGSSGAPARGEVSAAIRNRAGPDRDDH